MAKAATAKKKLQSSGVAEPPVIDGLGLAKREWDRGTAIVSLFVATGSFFENRVDHKSGDKGPRIKPANLIFVSEPGRGKTELLDRFRPNRNLEFKSDLTVRGLWRVLEHADSGQTTHIVATEFQKFFQRKAAIADNMFGTMIQAMEEGVDRIDVGPKPKKFNHARLGIIGAITNGTMENRQDYLREMGFISRAAVFPWELPAKEMREIMTRISDGIVDLNPVKLILPEQPIPVMLPPELSRKLEPYVWDKWKGEVLRVFSRFRQMLMATAVLDGRDIVKLQDLDYFHTFDEYWERMITE